MIRSAASQLLCGKLIFCIATYRKYPKMDQAILKGVVSHNFHGSSTLKQFNKRLLFADVPNKPPSRPTLDVLDAYSLRVHWHQSTAEEGNPITGYIILVRFVYFVCNI